MVERRSNRGSLSSRRWGRPTLALGVVVSGLRACRRVAPWLMVSVTVWLCGCGTLGFYGQAVKGECSLLLHQRRIEKIMADPQAPIELKQRLEVVAELRSFAQGQLKLPVEGNYQKYVDVHRKFVVWNVEAAPEFSMAAKTWWYPFLGWLSYRGYFSETAAQRYARSLERGHLEVTVGGVPAYSTLGWFKDPLLSTFLFEPETELAETLFHELAHQRLFAHGDTDFNEAFATAVGEEGVRRWLKSRGDVAALDAYEGGVQRTRQFARLVMTTRHRLEELYGDERTPGGKVKSTTKNSGIPREQLRRGKQAVLEQLRRDYAVLKAGWGGNDDYDNWVAAPLNNARLNSIAAYYDLVPGFDRMLAAGGGDLEEFFRAAERLSKRPKAERRQQLEVATEEEMKLNHAEMFQNRCQTGSLGEYLNKPECPL